MKKHLVTLYYFFSISLCLAILAGIFLLAVTRFSDITAESNAFFHTVVAPYTKYLTLVGFALVGVCIYASIALSIITISKKEKKKTIFLIGYCCVLLVLFWTFLILSVAWTGGV